MAEDALGFRFNSFDELVFNTDEDAVRDAGMKLMNDVGFGQVNQSAGRVEIGKSEAPDMYGATDYVEGGDFLF